ncbi:uncharacterized protein LOC131430523 [Malaya genurostris]|uniref:uncharacterized protein LOC131430523 n=1 Tax=Malaya genurostris TaxID=325434 RepID=UPI0026F3DF56|nr:uncharacterized protein LOC131430523 [Malaya genurostris]
MAWRNVMSNGICSCCCYCCCNQKQILAVILIFTIAMGAPHSDTGSMSANYLTPMSPQGHFATRNNTKVTAQKGGTALLPCTVLLQSSALVSWVRRRDFQLLTVGLSTYSSDERFLVEHIRHMGHWALSIKAVRDEDRGLYECQLSVHPVQSVFIELNVIEAIADIVGAPDLHIDEGSTLRLECKLKRATEYPAYVFWYHEQSMVNFDQQNGFSVTPFQTAAGAASSAEATETGGHLHLHHPSDHQHQHQQLLHHRLHMHRQHHPQGTALDEDDGSFGMNALDAMGPPMLLDPASGMTEPGATELTNQTGENHHQQWLNHSGFLPYSHILSPVTSVLTIKEVHSKHAGNYTCAPSNTRSASIIVHVLQGEKPAAMQHANRSQLDTDSKAKGSASSAHSCHSQYSFPMPLWVLLLMLLLLIWPGTVVPLVFQLGHHQPTLRLAWAALTVHR